MTNKAVAEADAQYIDCGEVMDIAAMAAFRTTLLEALTSRQAVLLDASQVERADTAALQVLGAFIQDACSQQQVVQWKDPTQALCQSATLLGLSEILHLQPVTG